MMSWIHSLLRRIGSTPTPNRQARRARLSVSQLEDRVVPATLTWTGGAGAGDINWTTGANWGGSAPVMGDDLVFPDSGSLITENNYSAGMSFASISLEGNNTTIFGNSIIITDNITASYSSGVSSIELDIELDTAEVIVGTDAALSITGVLSGTGGLTLSGGGTLALFGTTANTYTGTTTVNDSELVLSKSALTNAITGDLVIGDGSGAATVRINASGQIPDAANVTVNEGATFNINGHEEFIDSLTLEGATVIIGDDGVLGVSLGIAANLTANDTVSTISEGTLNLNGASAFAIEVADDVQMGIELSISSVVANGGINKTGAGLLLLSGANTYAGDTTVSDGAIGIENDSALGTTAGDTTVSSGASVIFNGLALNVAESFSLVGNGLNSLGAIYTFIGATNVTGEVNLLGTSRIAAFSDSTLTLSGVIDDGLADPYGLTIGNSAGITGRVVLSGDNTFDGNITVEEGYLRLTHNNALGNSITITTTTVENAASLELTGGIVLPTNKGLELSGNGVSGTQPKIINVSGDNEIVGQTTLAGNEEIGVAANTSLTMGPITENNATARNLFKTGTGTLVMSGANSYTGGTFIIAGTMLANGTHAGGDTYIVSDGATLGGTGSTPAVTINNGGTLAPGTSPGTLTPATAGFFSGATYAVELNGTTAGTQYDQIVVSGLLVGGDLSVTIGGGFTPSIGDTFTIIQNDSLPPTLGTFTNLPEGTIFTVGSTSFRITYAGGSGITPNDVVLTVIESPIVAVSSSDSTSVFGQGVVFSAAVTGTSGTATGDAELYIDSTLIETVTLSSGVATFASISSLALGTYTVEIVYLGDTNYGGGSGSLSGSQVVNQADTTSSIVSADSTSVFGQSVLFTATISPNAPGAGTPGGTVEFFNGITSLGTVAVVNGIATITLSNLSLGTHFIGVQYDGDTNFAASAMTDVMQVVSQASTSASIMPIFPVATFSQSTSLVATVVSTPPSAGTPTGNVEIFDGTTSLGTFALSNGSVTINTTTLAVGTHTFSVVYAGTAQFATSTGATILPFTVSQASSTTTLVVPSEPAVFGEPISLTATISPNFPATATPTGTVEFFDGSTSLGTAPLVDGVATLNTSAVGLGIRGLTAVFLGSEGFATSTSDIASKIISPASTTVSITSSFASTVLGQSVTFTATVLSQSPSIAQPTGAVQFFDGATSLGFADLVNGEAQLTLSNLSVGVHAISVTYIGTPELMPSDSTSFPQTVAASASTITLATSAASTLPGQPVTFTATVAPVAPGTGTPSGTVEFFDGSTSLGFGTLIDGVASLTVSNLSPASHSITAVFAGTVDFAMSTSSAVSQSVTAVSVAFTLTSSSAEPRFGQPVTVTAAVVGSISELGIPGGTVSFSVDGVVVATVPLDASGNARFAFDGLSVGTRTITATFNPSSVTFASASGSLMQTVQAAIGNDIDGDRLADVIVSSATNFSHIRVLNSNGEEVRSFFAYDGFTGGVVTAGGDTNQDGFTDIVSGTSAVSSHVKVFDGATGDELQSFFAFDGFNGGVVVAAGDIDGDNRDDVVVGTRTGSSHVKVFSGADGSEIRSFFAFEGFEGGVDVTTGDVNGDGIDDIIVSAGSGSSHVKVFSGANGSLLKSFLAFEGYEGGVTVAAGDLDGDGLDEVVVAPASGSSHVKAFRGSDNSELHSFFALPDFSGRLSVAVSDADADGDLDLVIGGATGAANVKSFDGMSLRELTAFDAFEGFLGGVQVG